MRKRTIAAALFCLIAAGAPARADQTDPKLDGLFARLMAAPSADAAGPIEAEIWDIWSRSDNPEVAQLMPMGVALLGSGDHERARAVFDRITQIAPRFAEGWNKRATVLFELGRFAESKADIARVLALEPRHFGALSGLGLVDIHLDQPQEAFDAYRRARAIDPNLSGVEQNLRLLRDMLARQRT